MVKAVLTIDDVPEGNTRAIVDYLNEKGIQAIMFAWGQNLEAKREEAVYALQHGMILGNHSYSHPDFSKISVEEGIEEIEHCERLLNEAYAAAGVERKYRPFRFPYGNKGGANKAALQDYLLKAGFTKVKDTQITYPWWKESGLNQDIDTLWTFDFAEYNIRKGSGFTVDDVWKRINDMDPKEGAALLKDGNQHIVIIHSHDETEELEPGYYKLFIDYLLDHGVVFDAPEFIE